ncbi:MAG: DUF3834 domain-containing protein [Thermoplasmata archaeon]
MSKIKIIAAPGPVSFPLIAARDENFDIEFSKEKKGKIVLDSSVSMLKRGIRPNLSLIQNLSIISPDIGKTIAVWRKGSSNDVLLRASLKLKNADAKIIYMESQKDLMEAFKNGSVDSAVISSASGTGLPFEDILRDHGINMPGSCTAYVDDEYLSIFQ